MGTIRCPFCTLKSIALKRLDSSLIAGSLVAPRIKPCKAVWWEEKGQHSGLRGVLSRGDCLGVDVDRGSQRGVPHQLLHDFEFRSNTP